MLHKNKQLPCVFKIDAFFQKWTSVCLQVFLARTMSRAENMNIYMSQMRKITRSIFFWP